MLMPTYVYKFVKTGETIEVQQAFTDEPLTHAKHPDTGRKMAVKKVFTPVGVTFRGDGFYKTDSRSAGSSKSAGDSSTTDTSKRADTSSKAPSTGDAASSSKGSDKGASKPSSTSSATSGSSNPSSRAAD